MNKLSCSIIAPVFNEKEGIREFIHALINQTRTPDEIIIVDGGSKDGTYEYLQTRTKKGKIRLFQLPCNIAEARNYAITKAKHEIILCTDAGCQVNNDRCEQLMQIYETTNHKVVGGKSVFITNNIFQKYAKHRLISPDPNFHIISSRNFSFYKNARKEVDGYPEYLTKRGEDTYFNYKIKKAGYEIYYCPTAIVQWQMGKNYKAFYKMFRNYTQGDAEIFFIHKIIQSISIREAIIFSAFLIFLLFCIIFFGRYGAWYSILIIIISILLIGLYKRSPGGFVFDFKFSLIKMFGTTVGFWKGILSGLKIKSHLQKT